MTASDMESGHFGADGGQARALAEEIAKNAFHNVAYFDGDVERLQATLP